MNPSQDNFCHAPFLSLVLFPSGNVGPCCVHKESLGNLKFQSAKQIFLGQAFGHLRSQQLDGKRPPSCGSCWQREDRGGKSIRKTYHQWYGDNGQYSTRPAGVNPALTHLEVNFSNLCNLRCRMCSGQLSSRWDNDEVVLREQLDFRDETGYGPQEVKVADFVRDLPSLDQLRHVYIRGGEPMLQDSTCEFLSHIDRLGLSDKVSLRFTTNGTVFNREVVKMFSKFKDIAIELSLEGTGELYRYIRGENIGIEKLEQTIEHYNAFSNVGLSFNCALQAYNIFGISEVDAWISKVQTRIGRAAKIYYHNLVVSPGYLRVGVLPPELRRQAAEKIDNHLARSHTNLDYNRKQLEYVVSVLMSPRQEDPLLLQQFKRFTLELDRMRGADIRQAVPELRPLFDQMMDV